jgi:hypothetical protein
MPAATEALSDSMPATMGMLTRQSHVSPTSRDRPGPLGADHDDHGVGEDVRRQVGEGGVGVSREADHREAPLLEGLQGPGHVRHLGHRHPRQRPRGRLPARRSDPHRAARGDEDPVGPERRCRAGDGAEVAGVGDAVERDDEGALLEVGGVGVDVLRHRQDQPLVDAVLGHAVELGLGHLEDGDAGADGQAHRLAPAVVGLELRLDVERGRGHLGAQGLDHGVAAHEHAARRTTTASAAARSRTRGPAATGAALGPLLGGPLAPRRGMVRPVDRLGRRLAALEGLPLLAARTGGCALLGAVLAHRAAAL